MPDTSAVERELAGSPVKALEFETQGLGGWDSALMVRVLELHDLCSRGKVEFRSQTLPPGLAKLIALSQAVPEKTDAARRVETPLFLQRVGESGLEAWTGGKAMLSFLGESVVAFLKLLRGRAQYRWSDTLLVMQECGPEALGIVDINRPDYGDPVPVRPGEVPVFWACGVTPQAVAQAAEIPLMITHSPGHMFITDRLNKSLAG